MWRYHELGEVLAYQALYLSLAPWIAWLFLRNGVAPTALFGVNPRLRWGGSGFDSKFERYRIFASSPFAIPTVLIEAETVFDEPAIRRWTEDAGLAPPLIAKPNRGHLSQGVRKLDTLAEAAAFFGAPRTVDFLVQPFVSRPHEFSVFYGRMPGEKGTVLDVTERVLPPLVIAGGRAEGARFVQRPDLATPQLAEALDASAAPAEFHFGKFDVKAATPAAVAEGRDLCILEVNGCTAQLTSIFDERFTFWTARRALARQAEFLVALSARMARRKTPPTLRQLRREWAAWREVSRR